MEERGAGEGVVGVVAIGAERGGIVRKQMGDGVVSTAVH
jgi:hypothetical protein